MENGQTSFHTSVAEEIASEAPPAEAAEVGSQVPPRDFEEDTFLANFAPEAGASERVSQSMTSFLTTCIQEDSAAPAGPWSSERADFSYLDLIGPTTASPVFVLEGIPVDQDENRGIVWLPPIFNDPNGERALAVFQVYNGLLLGARPAPRGDGRRARNRGARSQTAAIVRANSRVKILEEEAGYVCPICLDEMALGSRVRMLACRHVLHEACANDWFRNRGAAPECPTCHRVVGGNNRRARNGRGHGQAAQAPAAVAQALGQ